MDVEALIEQLTLEEKVLLTSGNGWWHTAAIERLSIPPIRLSDGPNGVRGTHFFDSTPSACLPCGTALGATFDTDLAYRVGRLLSEEARAKGAHVLLGPTVNIQRGPLGGRGFESLSEDPLLSGILAAHYVRGVQESGVSATLKHFVCNDMESERMAVNALVTSRAMREIYLLPFMIAIEMAQPRAVMTAYNKVNDCHASENRHILQDILRDEWNWDGLVMSDWFGTYSTSSAVKAGLDLEMPGPTRWRGEALSHAVAANKVKDSELNERVRNVLKLVKHATENTSIPPNAPETELDTPEHAALLREAAAKSLVLLKNERSILPFDPNKKIAVIGPNANVATYCGGGSAGLRGYTAVTPLEGITALASDVVFAQGAYGHQSLPLLGKSLRTLDGKRRGFVLRVYNEPPPKGGADTRVVVEERVLDDSNIWFVDYENPKLAPVWYAEAEGILVPETSGEWEFGLSVHGTAELFIDGELAVSNVENQRPGSSFLGSGTVEETARLNLVAGQSYRILVKWGCSSTSKLRMAGGVDFGQGGLRFSGCPTLDPATAVGQAVEVAKSVDQVVVCAGLSGEWETEGQDRVNMALPPGTDELIAAVTAANPNTAVVVQSGTPVAMPWLDQAGAVLQAWFGGNQGGNGIADVLLGVVNPGGKLPLTMPRRVADNPSALSHRSDNGRVLYSEDVYVGYRWYDTLDILPLFAFGHGLSYTTFELSGLEVEELADTTNGHVNCYPDGHHKDNEHAANGHSSAASRDAVIVDDAESLVVRVKVTNTGSRAGAEVVQVYVAPAASSPLTSSVSDTITRPAKELKGFAKVHVDAGASAVGEIKLDLLRATSYWSEMEDCWRSDAGSYGVLAGTSSRGKFLEKTVVVERTRRWKGLRA
ncbi:Beta-glucosidase [Tolypocladium paradoxum]|uniref:beta-glucosidase n=1 Tax=Tolypocladium paradoxum TaxID=94208 RepID=A0A2S4KZM5_9HYPO|nr:Beta-glucosidase [Tolypocladium paradoxum]